MPRLLVMGVVILTLGLILGCDKEPQPVDKEGPDTPAVTEEGEDEHEAVPPEYASLENPVSPDEESLRDGGELYRNNCARCHGIGGKGDGPKAETLTHHPADLSDAHMMADMTDAAIFWRISEGVHDTEMPAWEDRLGEQDRWKLVNHLRTFAVAEETDEAAETHEPREHDNND